MVEAGLVLGGLEALLDRPATAGHPDRPGGFGSGGSEADVVGDLVGAIASLADEPSPLDLSSLVEVLTRRLATEQRLTLAKWILLDAIPDDPGPAPPTRASRRSEEARRKGSILRALDTVKVGEVGDPWGVASCWISPSELFDGQSPLDLLKQNRLTEIAVDNVAADDAEGM